MRVVLHLVLLLVLVVVPSWRAQSSSYVCHADHQGCWSRSLNPNPDDAGREGKTTKTVFEVFFVAALLTGLSSIAGVSSYLKKL